ncbi:MAG: outer membrane lipoprotein carrier protein LolA [Prevotella sp.]|nr:outer membrane lipoprotein carrier protein LolA [Prevotella sp.]
MKKLFLLLFCTLALSASAQNVVRTQHRAAITQDAVTTGAMTIRKPDYISISTDGGKELLIMDGTKFTMTMGGKQHVTDSRKNEQFATFHAVLKAVINNQPIPSGDDLTVTTKNGQTTVTITPTAKKRQLFTSFVLTIDAKTSAIRSLRMNGRKGDYTDYKVQ